MKPGDLNVFSKKITSLLLSIYIGLISSKSVFRLVLWDGVNISCYEIIYFADIYFSITGFGANGGFSSFLTAFIGIFSV